MQPAEIQDSREQAHKHERRPWPWKRIGLIVFILVVLSLSVRVWSNRQQPTPVPSSTGLVFVQWAESSNEQQLLYNISARDATVHWKLELSITNALSVVRGETIYVVGFNQKIWKNEILALRTKDGSMLWKTSLPAQGPIAAQPVIADGNIYLGERTGGPGQIFALSLANGKLLWSLSLEGYASSDSDQPLAAGSGLLFVGSTEGMIRAYHSANGALAWSSSLTNRAGRTILPFFSNGMLFVYLPVENEVVALRAQDKEIQWHLQQNDFVIYSLAIRGTHLYLFENVPGEKGYTSYVDVFDTRSRQLLWRQRIENGMEGSVEEVAGIAYISSSNYFYALHADSGRLIWQKQGSARMSYGQAVFVDGVIFVKIDTYAPWLKFCLFGCHTPPPTMDAYRASDGSLYWTYEATSFADHSGNPPGVAVD